MTLSQGPKMGVYLYVYITYTTIYVQHKSVCLNDDNIFNYLPTKLGS